LGAMFIKFRRGVMVLLPRAQCYDEVPIGDVTRKSLLLTIIAAEPKILPGPMSRLKSALVLSASFRRDRTSAGE
jgi:hypothetical protein